MPVDQILGCNRAYDWNPSRTGRETDYAYAHSRTKQGRRYHDARRYEIARKSILAKRKKDKQPLSEVFRQQVDLWKHETGHLSSLRKAVAHPSYLRIIGLANESSGFEIERLLLHELEAEPDHWFPALAAITGQNPVKPEDDFDDAVAAWLNWGKAKGII
jgi:hypothetical protein